MAAPRPEHAHTYMVDSGLRDLSITRDKFEKWTVAGIRKWDIGGSEQNCITVCINSGLECRAHLISSISKDDTGTLFTSVGISCNGIIGLLVYLQATH